MRKSILVNVVVLALTGCDRPSPLPEARRVTPPPVPTIGQRAVAEAAAVEATARDAAPADVAATEDGTWSRCYANYRRTSTPARDVTRLGLLCGPENGMRLVHGTIEGQMGTATTERGFDFKAGDCLRVFVAADTSLMGLTVQVRDAVGTEIASSRARAGWAVVSLGGPFCIETAGRYTLRLRARQGTGHYAVQVWRLP
jgi:hypothetical protein